MKIKDHKLYSAIAEIYGLYERSNLKPRSSKWLIFSQKRYELCQHILTFYEGNAELSEETILKAWDDFGKNKKKFSRFFVRK